MTCTFSSMKKNKVLVVHYSVDGVHDNWPKQRAEQLQRILEEENKKGWSFVWGGGDHSLKECPTCVVLEKEVS